MKRRRGGDAVIRASEIGQWVYCQRAWHLARQGHENRNVAALRAGTVAHERHARVVASAQRTRTLALILLLLAVLVLALAMLALALT